MPLEFDQTLIARLLALPVHERADYLRNAFNNDPGLRGRFDEIIQAATEAKPQGPAALPSSDGERAMRVR